MLRRARVMIGWRPFVLVAATLLQACGAGPAAQPSVSTPPVALFTTLPILWAETPDIRDLLTSDAPPHRVLTALGGPARVHAVDTLADRDAAMPVDRGTLLVLAQPRPLSPQENVALDDWVRGGGHVLLFADPLLTEESVYPFGDKRRPQDVVLLSPILRRWGLDLRFDEDQPAGERTVPFGGGQLPVNLPGSFALIGGGHDCALSANDIVAHCQIGNGSVLAVADAALLESGLSGEPAEDAAAGAPVDAQSRAALLQRLIRDASVQR